jgi:hypothetical protein
MYRRCARIAAVLDRPTQILADRELFSEASMNLAAGARACFALSLWLLAAAARAQIVPLPPLADEGAAVAYASDQIDLGAQLNLGQQGTFAPERPIDELLAGVDDYGPDYSAWHCQWLPGNLLYPAYLASAKESRFASFWAHDEHEGGMWDIALGGRAGIVRYGSDDCRPDGFQMDIEGAAFPRLDLDHREDLMATDFRFGVPLTYGEGPWRTKFGFYHLSSHVGDEYLLKNPTFQRINYSRNALVWGNAYFFSDDTRGYVEIEFATDSDISEPWAYQFGLDYSPSGMDGRMSAPFAAMNVHLRQEVNFSGNVVLQAGWQWRSTPYGHLFRAGAEYFDGKSDQFEFYTRTEQKIGLGVWYDF